jgi:hypothetical protein
VCPGCGCGCVCVPGRHGRGTFSVVTQLAVSQPLLLALQEVTGPDPWVVSSVFTGQGRRLSPTGAHPALKS